MKPITRTWSEPADPMVSVLTWCGRSRSRCRTPSPPGCRPRAWRIVAAVAPCKVAVTSPPAVQRATSSAVVEAGVRRDELRGRRPAAREDEVRGAHGARREERACSSRPGSPESGRGSARSPRGTSTTPRSSCEAPEVAARGVRGLERERGLRRGRRCLVPRARRAVSRTCRRQYQVSAARPPPGGTSSADAAHEDARPSTQAPDGAPTGTMSSLVPPLSPERRRPRSSPFNARSDPRAAVGEPEGRPPRSRRCGPRPSRVRPREAPKVASPVSVVGMSDHQGPLCAVSSVQLPVVPGRFRPPPQSRVEVTNTMCPRSRALIHWRTRRRMRPMSPRLASRSHAAVAPGPGVVLRAVGSGAGAVEPPLRPAGRGRVGRPIGWSVERAREPELREGRAPTRPASQPWARGPTRWRCARG